MLREAELTVNFASQDLERLYTENIGADGYTPETVKLFRRRVRHIEAATDLNDLQCPSLVNYRRLKVDYPPTSALELSEGWDQHVTGWSIAWPILPSQSQRLEEDIKREERNKVPILDPIPTEFAPAACLDSSQRGRGVE